ncbi:MAG TPA: alcohol dehydrogenase catalytic domain-containing protein, partial [Anaerolineae bacterium]|nr:alcohol dehydrogenase catalytic domain-containing protein [Anaerolineae bacterium]
MKAALLYGQEDLRIEEVRPQQAGPYGLRLRVLACGICGSDARMFFSGPSPRYIQPVILGHELCAEVMEVGLGLEGYSPGDVVTVAPVIPCLRCAPCSRGEDNLCEEAQVIGCTVHGGLAEQITMPAQMVHAGGVVHVP